LGVVVLQNVKEGAVLEQDVRDINGRLLLSKGQAVNSQHIRVLKIWGIPEVDISEPDQSAASAPSLPDPQKMIRAEQSAKMVLQNTDLAHPAIAVVLAAAVDYRYENDLLLAFGPPQPLSQNFKFDLSSGLKAQIEFSEIELPESSLLIADFNEVVQDPSSSANGA